ncbi:hypothetical protein BUQ74_11775 [Leptospira weilii serovar Heyan]|uniref:Uncharacterized protein n=1 Tax=Leptospira weilii str. UI 13098 TaxID=1088542 RepID=M6Q3U8_9LEPT|nr:hypothetical protein LEP1GSC108_4868 [Leptospira weilii str. UI 13098]OMI17146.1 hypothetical protein BUQ74_11775 [Leptospira weilii serovar Heyan]
MGFLRKTHVKYHLYFYFSFESAPKPFDLIRISADRWNCSYVSDGLFYVLIYRKDKSLRLFSILLYFIEVK